MDIKETAKKYTYEDYANRDEDERFEIIDGVIYMMAPPSQAHQEIVGELHGQLWSFLKGKPCKVFVAPFGVRLYTADYDSTIVEPDILIVCDMSKLDGKVCNGAADIVPVHVLDGCRINMCDVFRYD